MCYLGHMGQLYNYYSLTGWGVTFTPTLRVDALGSSPQYAADVQDHPLVYPFTGT